MNYDFKNIDYCTFYDVKFILNTFRNDDIEKNQIPNVYKINQNYPIWIERRIDYITQNS